jgi:hypothetical protein
MALQSVHQERDRIDMALWNSGSFAPDQAATITGIRILSRRLSMRGFLDRSNKLGRHGSEFLTHHISQISRHQPLSQRLVDQPLITLALRDHLSKLF